MVDPVCVNATTTHCGVLTDEEMSPALSTHFLASDSVSNLPLWTQRKKLPQWGGENDWGGLRSHVPYTGWTHCKTETFCLLFLKGEWPNSATYSQTSVQLQSSRTRSWVGMGWEGLGCFLPPASNDKWINCERRRALSEMYPIKNHWMPF